MDAGDGVTAHPNKAGDVVLPEADGVGIVLFPLFFNADSVLCCYPGPELWATGGLSEIVGSGWLSSKRVISRDSCRGCPFPGPRFGSVIARWRFSVVACGKQI